PPRRPESLDSILPIRRAKVEARNPKFTTRTFVLLVPCLTAVAGDCYGTRSFVLGQERWEGASGGRTRPAGAPSERRADPLARVPPAAGTSPAAPQPSFFPNPLSSDPRPRVPQQDPFPAREDPILHTHSP